MPVEQGSLPGLRQSLISELIKPKRCLKKSFQPVRYDIFCKIVDNFGDAAVCWRLARQLANEHGHAVRLWLDQPNALGLLRPELDSDAASQVLDGVEVRCWPQTMLLEDPGDIVVEGFGCGLPEQFTEAMAQRSPASLWIVLEYLSAEPWVSRYHGLPSPHPRLALKRYYFFPGFTDACGGLLREAGLSARRKAFQGDPVRRIGFWRDLGFDPPQPEAQTVSLFGYENPNLSALLDAWSNGGSPVIAAVPPSRLRHQIVSATGDSRADNGATLHRGLLEIRLIPFVAQARYDELLWSCDWNFVRGEDSFVRAQWAAAPFVWHIYPQDQEIHFRKLEAFLAVYTESAEPAAGRALAAFWRSWNGSGQFLVEYWPELEKHRKTLHAHATEWECAWAEKPDLATNLAFFCAERLKLTV